MPVITPTAAGVPNPGPEVSRKRSDGHTYTIAGWKGLSLGEDGFLTITGEYKDQRHTRRSGYDHRQQYPAGNAAREAIINRFNAWTGEPELEQLSLFANAGYDLDNGAELSTAGPASRTARRSLPALRASPMIRAT